MSNMYKYYLQKYLEKITNLESHLLFLRDKNGLLEGIGDIDLFLYPHKVITIDENVLFRSRYEVIKHNRDKYYILVIKEEEIQNKLIDFIKRSEEGRIKDITIQKLLECIEEDLKWNENINQFNISDIKTKFEELVYYRKLFRKKNIEKYETNKIVISALLGLDSTQVKDEVDCYLYYRDIRVVYGTLANLKYRTNLKELLYNVFFECGSLMANVVKLDIFEEFNQLIWTCCALNTFDRLSKENIRAVLEDNFTKIEALQSHLEELVDFTNRIGKKDKKYYIQKKDWAEQLILKAKIDVLSNEYSYKDVLREGKGSLISVIESIKSALKDFNLEGIKKVYKYTLDNLFELQVIIEDNVSYKTENINKLMQFYAIVIDLFKKIEYAEKQSMFTNDLNSYTEWELLYKNYLYDLQYKLSQIRYLDNQDVVEKFRYQLVDKRINNLLNHYRKQFAEFLQKNYSSWKETPYGISRPVLNSDIQTLINLDNEKIFILVFDGMRYDAWEYIVKPYFEKIFTGKNLKYKSSFALLPSITSISREVIYSNILKNYKDDAVYLTKSESMKNENELKESILQNKKINVLVFNMFDKDGHKATEDFYVFYDKQRKVFENRISELVKMIPEEANIYITSDHGLMRVDENENMKDIEQIRNIKPRYLEADKYFELEGCINVQVGDSLDLIGTTLLAYDNKSYFVGGGEKDFYTHGGASLEEVIVPFVLAETKVSKKQSTSKEENIVVIHAQTEDFALDKNHKVMLSFKLNAKEQVILTSLYNLKNQNISNRDMEKILVNRLGSAGMVEAMISRLNKKLKKDGFDIIEESAAGDLIMYKFNYCGLKEEK